MFFLTHRYGIFQSLAVLRHSLEPALNVCCYNNDNYCNRIIEAKTLQVSNIGLGSLKAFSSEDCELNEELVTLGTKAF